MIMVRLVYIYSLFIIIFFTNAKKFPAYAGNFPYIFFNQRYRNVQFPVQVISVQTGIL